MSRLRCLNRLANTYLDIKQYVLDSGFEAEITWQECLSFDRVEEHTILTEAAWVILNSGMREGVIRAKFAGISRSFCNWESALSIQSNRSRCLADASRYFAHPGKLNAIASVADIVAQLGVTHVKDSIRHGSIDYVRTWPYLGPATSYHLLKNLGFDIVKPDRHLLRIAATAGFCSPGILCSAISERIGDRVSVIDLVLWRYATLDRQYLSRF